MSTCLLPLIALTITHGSRVVTVNYTLKRIELFILWATTKKFPFLFCWLLVLTISREEFLFRKDIGQYLINKIKICILFVRVILVIINTFVVCFRSAFVLLVSLNVVKYWISHNRTISNISNEFPNRENIMINSKFRLM